MNSKHNVIDSFTGEYRFLSNFYPSPIVIDSICYPTVEHAFQAAKTKDKLEQRRIAIARTPAKAKSLGRKVRLRKDWENVKVGIMKQCVELKFDSHADLAVLLLATGTAKLIEGNTWNDTFWGVCGGRGKNQLGKVLMRVRSKLAASIEESAESLSTNSDTLRLTAS